MRYEVWKLAADCSSFSLSHTSNLTTGAAKKPLRKGDIYTLQVVSWGNAKDKRGKLNQTEREKRGRLQHFGDPLFFWTGVSGPPESPSTLNLSPHRGEITQTANRREVNKHGVHGTWRAVDTASSVALSVRHWGSRLAGTRNGAPIINHQPITPWASAC